MPFELILTEKEIIEHPNNYELGEYIRKQYWEMKNPNSKVESKNKVWTCSICGKDTSEVEYDYLVGYDHLSCRLNGDPKKDEKDICVICGKETPYLKSTHIDQRIGYVEGGGQGCYQPNICDKN